MQARKLLKVDCKGDCIRVNKITITNSLNCGNLSKTYCLEQNGSIIEREALNIYTTLTLRGNPKVTRQY